MVSSKFAGVRLWVILAAALFAALALGGEARADERSAADNVREYRTDLEWEDSPEAVSSTREPQIVGGEDVPNGGYPFTAFVLIRNALGQTSQCTGTLIDRDSVLTAAHCLEGAVGVRVFVGRTVVSDASQGQTRDAVEGVSHPQYTGANYRLDAAVLNLESPVSGIQPVRLATAEQDAFERPGRYARTAGWGTTSEGGTTSDRLRSVRLLLRGETFARDAYASTGNPTLRYFPAFMIAAGTAGKDACQGDSGGPLFVQQGQVFTQLGVTSYGLGCARRGFPGVWTEVNSPNIRPFIINASRR